MSPEDENFYFCEVTYSKAENGKIVKSEKTVRFPETGVLTINGVLKKPLQFNPFDTINFSFVRIIYICAALLFVTLLGLIIFVTLKRKGVRKSVSYRENRSRSFLAREKAERLLVALPEN